jgi:hypothetical protein
VKNVLFLSLLVLATAACNNPKKTTDANALADSAAVVATADGTATDTADAGVPEMFSPDNFIIIPGQQVGNITANSTEAQLKQMLGDELVKADTLFGPEGDFTLATSLFANTPDQVYILWQDTTRRARPESVIIQPADKQEGTAGKETQWLIVNGPRIGSTLKEVQTMNGKPFTLYGFGWDYGGNVSNFNGGKLGPAKGQSSQLSLRFSADFKTDEKLSGKIMGDSEFSSALPAMQQVNPKVGQITVHFKK